MACFPKFSISTMNMSGASFRGATKYKRESICNAIEQSQVDIIFAQEISAPRSDNWLLDIKGYNFIGYTREAGIAYRTETFTFISVIEHTEKMDVAHQLWSQGLSHTDEFSSRSCIVILRHNRSGEMVICVSWHGPHKQKNKDKEIILQALLHCVYALAEKNCIPDTIVIGGDFNFMAFQAAPYMIHGFNIHYDNPCAIDYFVHRGLTLNDVSRHAYHDNKGGLDHGYVTASVAILSSRKEYWTPQSQPQPGQTQYSTRSGSSQFQSPPGPYQHQ